MPPASRRTHARRLFGAIAHRYDRPAAVLGLGQYGRWRRAAVRALGLPTGARVLDVACGTGLVSRDLQLAGARVVGADLSEPMAAAARRRGVEVVCADADALPFAPGTFDGLVFTYLLRYVEDPPATIRALATLVRTGGRVASVEFGVPRGAAARALWRAYAHAGFPLIAAAVSPGWRAVGRFLGRSIESWGRAWPPRRLEEAWRDAGIADVRTRAMSLGGGVVMWGTRAG